MPAAASEDVQKSDAVEFGFELRTSAALKRDDQFYRATLEIQSEGELVQEVPLWVVIRPE